MNSPVKRSPLSLVVVAVVAAALGLLSASSALVTAAGTGINGFTASNFAMAFPNSGAGGVGPVGVAFDPSNNLFVMDYFNGILYKFTATGGAAAGHEVNVPPIAGAPAGLAFSKTGRLYVARQGAGDVVELSTITGQILRTVVAGLPGATGIATDPISGDLFVSTLGNAPTIRRITNPEGAPSVTGFASPGFTDGLAFGPDGTLYAAVNDNSVFKVNSAGTATFLATVPSVDGTAVAASNIPSNPPFLFGNRNDGKITKVDLTTSPPTLTDIVTGGSRGDFVTVGPDGCLYATQTDLVEKVTNADGTCSLAPVGLTLSLTPPTQTHEVGQTATLTATINNATSPGGTVVTFTVTGANPQVGTAIASASGQATFSYAGLVVGDDTVVATATVQGVNLTSPNATVHWTADPPISAHGTTVSATEGASVTGTVATVTDPDPAAVASEYTASITWGDGTAASAGTISGPTGGPFTVMGTHTYAEEGSYTVTVTIADMDNTSNTATANSSATVADAALHASCAAPATSAQAFSGPTATFTDDDPGGVKTDYTTTINWGDGSPTAAGTISGGPGGGPYTVSGSHTYVSTGTFTITTTITDHTASASASCTALVFAFAPGGGAFVIGDKNSTTGTQVTFWGAQWAKINAVTGGSGPNSFKGFAGSPSVPSCGATWSTAPGNSTPPPTGPLPAYMGVIVSSSISQSGATITGNITSIVVVQTNAGYAADPGHAGTGTVVATIC